MADERRMITASHVIDRVILSDSPASVEELKGSEQNRLLQKARPYLKDNENYNLRFVVQWRDDDGEVHPGHEARFLYVDGRKIYRDDLLITIEVTGFLKDQK